VADDEAAIVEALNALRLRYTYVFTTGGIGPTHDDITADSVAKAFGVAIDYDPRAVALLKERYAAMGTELNAARMRMTRVPKGAELVPTRSRRRPDFLDRQRDCHGGRAVDHAGHARRGGAAAADRIKIAVRTVRADCREGDVGTELGEIAKGPPEVNDSAAIPFRGRSTRPETPISWFGHAPGAACAATAAIEDMR